MQDNDRPDEKRSSLYPYSQLQQTLSASKPLIGNCSRIDAGDLASDASLPKELPKVAAFGRHKDQRNGVIERRTKTNPHLPCREESRIAIYLVIHRGFQVPVEVCCNSAIVSAERYGYFGLRRSLSLESSTRPCLHGVL